MQYRKFGQLDWQVSALGFGAMRLPVNGDDKGDIYENEAIKMIRYAIDNGVNYIDTAWPYHDGNSELVVGKALRDGYREKVKLATKLPSWLIEKQEDMDMYLDKQLEKLQTDCIDFYLLHTLKRKHWKNYKEKDVFSWIEKVINEGKIKHIGFSFHDDYKLFTEIIDAYDWDFCQIQYNYLDTEFQAGRKGLKYAADKGIGVVIMEPLRGGKLAVSPPKEVQKIWEESEIDRAPADRALQWLWNQPEVSVVLSGMSTFKQVKENINSACNSEIGSISEKELKLYEKAQEKLRGPVECTGCAYCMPCPTDVDIPHNFSLYNEAYIYDQPEKKQEEYMKMKKEARASSCISCGHCESVCPQNLEIISLLEDVVHYFSAE